MSLSLGQVTTNTSSAVPIGVLGPGMSVTLQTTGANINYVGTSSTVTTGNGFPLNNGGPPVTITLPVTSTAVNLFAISVTGASALGVAFASTS